MIVSKEINHAQLVAELVAAGIAVIGLGQAEDGELWGYDQAGTRIVLPASAVAVIAAHVPAPPAPGKNDILLSLLDGLVPGDEATEVILLVQMEMLRP